MKILYIINSSKYRYHNSLVTDFISITGGNTIDTAGADPGKQYYEIKEIAPDVVVTYDLAGHIYRTGNDTLSMNNIYAKFAHILFHRAEHYGHELKARQNLSMFTFIPQGEDIVSYRGRFPEVPNITEFVPFSYMPVNENERENNLVNIKCWWDDFKKISML